MTVWCAICGKEIPNENPESRSVAEIGDVLSSKHSDSEQGFNILAFGFERSVEETATIVICLDCLSGLVSKAIDETCRFQLFVGYTFDKATRQKTKKVVQQ